MPPKFLRISRNAIMSASSTRPAPTLDTISAAGVSVVLAISSDRPSIVSTVQESFLSAIFSVEFSYFKTTECYTDHPGCFETYSELIATTVTTRSELTKNGLSTVFLPAPATPITTSTILSSSPDGSSSNGMATALAGAIGGCAAFFIFSATLIGFIFLRRRGKKCKMQKQSEVANDDSQPTTHNDHVAEVWPQASGQAGQDQVEQNSEVGEKQIYSNIALQASVPGILRPSQVSPRTESQNDLVHHELEARPMPYG